MAIREKRRELLYIGGEETRLAKADANRCRP
jgi:hypothetical protein